MISQSKPHIEIISEFAELILNNRLASLKSYQKNPNHFNLIFQESSHNVYEQLSERASRLSKYDTIGVEICFFLQNQESRQQLVESWIISVHILNRTLGPTSFRQQSPFDNQQSDKLCILQSRGISSFLYNIPLFYSFININRKVLKIHSLYKKHDQMDNAHAQNTLLHTLRFCEPELELNKDQAGNFTQHIFPPVTILCAIGVKGSLQIKIKYLNELQKLQFNNQNYISQNSEIGGQTSSNNLISHQQIIQNANISNQNALYEESSNRVYNSSGIELSDLRPLLQCSNQPSFLSTDRIRTVSFSTQLAIYSKKDDVVLLMTAESAIAIDQKSDEEFDYQMIQQDKLGRLFDIEQIDDWQMIDKDKSTVPLQRPKVDYKHSELWNIIQEQKRIFQVNLKHQKRLAKFQLLKTILSVKEI